MYYMLEPWGWHNTEYLFGSVLAMLYNINRRKNDRARRPEDFMRNMEQGLLRYINNHEMAVQYENMTREEKQVYLRRMFSGWVKK